MEKTEFAKLLRNEVESKTGKEVRLTKVLKNNDVTLTGMSNWDHNYGAVEMIYGTSTLKEFADKMESDLYVLPCSVHEVILIPLEYDEEIVRGYSQMVREINKFYVEPEEVLADHIYFFSRKEGRVRLAE